MKRTWFPGITELRNVQEEAAPPSLRKVPVMEIPGQGRWHILKLTFSFSPSDPGSKLPIKCPLAFVSPPLGRFCENRSPRGSIQRGRGGSLSEHWRHGGDVRLPLLPDRAGPRAPGLCPRWSVCRARPLAGDEARGWCVSHRAARGGRMGGARGLTLGRLPVCRPSVSSLVRGVVE